MNLLAIDASTELASVALKINEEYWHLEQDTPKTHAQLLLPLIDSILQQAGAKLSDLDAIVFGCGPGSFTGLRIACSIAKGLAYAHNLPLIPVSCLAAIAYSVREQQKNHHLPVLAAVDARMNEVYWSYFAPNEWLGIESVNPAANIKIPRDIKVICAGVGLEQYWSTMSPEVTQACKTTVDVYPNAKAMIGLAEYAAISPIPAADAQPVYVRNQVTQGDSGG